MADILSRVKQHVGPKKKEKKLSLVTQHQLEDWGLTGIQLRPYQLDGVCWLTQCLENQQGCILGDEMGLGKTCQAISLLIYIFGAQGVKGPFLILSPVSLLENWRMELSSLAPCLTLLCYKGDKAKRAEIQRENTQEQDFHVLLTTYELALKDTIFLKRWQWKVLVVDEAQRLKNQKSQLHQTLTQLSVAFRILMTGTPIQNNLQELYSLLTLIQPSTFSAEQADHFSTSYCNVQKDPALAAELQTTLEPFLLRRVKSQVALDLPKKKELVVYHGMSLLQKKLYKAILMKNVEVFGNEQENRVGLLNILMNLRKCVGHPYLFNGVEPEPFEMGEHLVQASGKLCLLDSLLAYLHKRDHRILLFSQMTRMLDILQDYLEFRGYSYERLDGSVRGEERNLAVKNFSSKDIFIFLLSTKAGGVGLNLTAADTVIFMDTDFNPQNDLQAAARCHRIGQNRPVKVIRLLARHTVEEIMYSRAISKLNLTKTVIEEGRFSLLEQVHSGAAGLQLSEILKFGVDKLLSSEESSMQEVKLEKILGPSRGGQWADDEDVTSTREEMEEEEEEEENVCETDKNHMYYYEGKDYSKEPSCEDQSIFERMIEEQLGEIQKTTGEGRALRHKAAVSLSLALGIPVRKRKILTPAELELRQERRQKAAAKRAKIQEEKKKKEAEQKHQKKMALWKSSGYKSPCLPSVDTDDDDDDEDDNDNDDLGESSEDSERSEIHYVLGDVTRPHTAQGDVIIVHCVDDSGRWGSGGLFSALEIRSDEPKTQYELAGQMDDLEVGNVLLFSIDDKQSRANGTDRLALVVAQQRLKDNSVSAILLPALNEGLKKIRAAAKPLRASVHLPRLGHSTPGFNWYGTERLIRKHLSSRGVDTFIYYHSRSDRKSTTATSNQQLPGRSDGEADKASPMLSLPVQSPDPCDLPSFMTGVHVFFYNLAASERKRLARYLITYDGDEEEVMSDNVTHVVAEVENNIHSQELQRLIGRYIHVTPVDKKWLLSCFSKQRRVGVDRFKLQLE